MKMLNRHFVNIILILVFLPFGSCGESTSSSKDQSASLTAVQPANEFKIIAYYSGGNKIITETVEQLNQIIYSFLHLKGNKLSVDSPADSLSIAYLTSLKEINPDLKVLLSLGGWGGCETCSDVFSTQKGRQEFAESVKELLELYNADGIDLDWEYPVVEGYPGHPFKPADRENFTSLVQELRRTLGEEAIISFAAGASTNFLEKSIEWKKVMPIVNHVNLMTYDFVTGGSSKTGHLTALFSTDKQSSSVDYAVRFLDSIGVPSDKMVIGSAFYARIAEGVEDRNHGLYQPGNFKKSVFFKDLDSFFKNNKGFEKFWDSTAQASYSYNAEKGLFATYDDSLSIARKTKYVIQNDLGGIMFWQLPGDKPKNGLVDVIFQIKSQL